MSIIKKGLSLIFNVWCIFWFIGIFLVLFPFIFFCIQIQSLNKYGTKITNFWADLFFIITFMPVKIEYKFKPDKKKAYVFVANHFSYLDVAITEITLVIPIAVIIESIEKIILITVISTTALDKLALIPFLLLSKSSSMPSSL